MTFLALIVLTLTSALAHADGGGDAVVCFNSRTARRDLRAIQRNGGLIPDSIIAHVESVESYDLAEARTPRGVSGGVIPAIETLAPTETPLAYARRVISRLERLTPGLFGELESTLDSLSESQVVLQPHGVVAVEDTDPTDSIDDERCVLNTISHHTTIGSRYFIHLDQRLYNHPSFSDLNKALLVLHAVVYLNAENNYGHTDGRLSRLFVGRLVTTNAEVTGRVLLDTARGARMTNAGSVVRNLEEHQFLVSCFQAWLLVGRVAQAGGGSAAIADRFHGALTSASWIAERAEVTALVRTYASRLEAATRTEEAWAITAETSYSSSRTPGSAGGEAERIGQQGFSISMGTHAAELMIQAAALADLDRAYPIPAFGSASSF